MSDPERPNPDELHILPVPAQPRWEKQLTNDARTKVALLQREVLNIPHLEGIIIVLAEFSFKRRAFDAIATKATLINTAKQFVMNEHILDEVTNQPMRDIAIVDGAILPPQDWQQKPTIEASEIEVDVNGVSVIQYILEQE